MAGSNYVVHYSTTTGFIIGMWRVDSSSNFSTAVAGGNLTVDGEDVIVLIGDRTDLAFAQISSPAAIETSLLTNVLEVNNLTTPTAVTFRADGDRDPDYPFES